MSVTYHVVVPFTQDQDGNVVPLEPNEAPSADAARRRARAAAEKHGGAVAFSRTGDPNTGDFEEARVIASFGAVDVGMLSE